MRKKILIADDSHENIELFKNIFADIYEVVVTSDGKTAIMELFSKMNSISAVIINIELSVVSGYQVLQLLNAKGVTEKIPIIMSAQDLSQQMELFCYNFGAVTILKPPFVGKVLKQRIINIINRYQKREKLAVAVKEQNEELQKQNRKLDIFYDDFTEVISDIIEFRDTNSGLHVKRVKGLTKIMAQTYMHLYPEAGMTIDVIERIVRASATHDIGKISIPDCILLKPGKLTDEERQVMMSHTTKGCEIFYKMPEMGDDEYIKVCYEICRHHHERYDGGGYPDGLAGDEIPLSAQLVSIVDVYDALVEERVYKRAYDKDTAFNMIMNGECGIFSPKILECFKYSRKIIELFIDTQQ
ncbi:MAG: HD domain-containing protein [Clostridiales bacterium]|nr:HD domain-containing protein [Clostridiales bacterium]